MIKALETPPDIELYTLLHEAASELYGEANVYSGELPPIEAAYPFAYIGSMNDTSLRTKNSLYGTISGQVDLWYGNTRERGDAARAKAKMMDRIRHFESDGYTWQVESLSGQILVDTTTATALLHAIVSYTLRYYYKED